MLSIFDQGPPKPCASPFNLSRHVLSRATELHDKIALSVLGPETAQNWTFGALEQAVRATGTGLLNKGLDPGDIVLMRLGNTVDFPIAYLGAISAGLVPVPTSSQLTETETASIISDLNIAAVLHDPLVASAEHPSIVSLAELRAMRDLTPCDWHMGDPERLAYVVYTSGTSGKPRAVAHAHRAIWARQLMVKGWYGLKQSDRLLHAGAFNWTYTLGTGLMDPWTAGATALIPEPGLDLGQIPALLNQAEATLFAAAPGVYRKFLEQGRSLELPTLRHGLCAGEKLSPDLHRRWTDATGTELYEAYGMSECSTFISSSPTHPAHGETLGRPQIGRRVAIVSETGPVPLGQEGVIAIDRNDQGLMLGYLNAPDESDARMQGEWFQTGDLGAMDADGQITFLGRDDDMMNAGGYRVSPLEVERVLATFPGVSQVGATDLQIKDDATIIAAFYTGPEKLDESELRTYVQDKLARYKQPRAYIHLSALPTSPNGKLLRRALPQYFKAETS